MFVPFFSPVLLVAREDERMYFYLPFRMIHLLFLTRDTFSLFCWPWVSLKRVRVSVLELAINTVTGPPVSYFLIWVWSMFLPLPLAHLGDVMAT